MRHSYMRDNPASMVSGECAKCMIDGFDLIYMFMLFFGSYPTVP